MRILVVGIPQSGHLTPMLPLIRSLVAGGDEVVVATGEAVRSTVEGVGARFSHAGTGFEEWFPRLASRIRGEPGGGLPPNRIHHYFMPRLFAEIVADDMIDGALAAGLELGPDLVLFDPGALAGPLVAELLGVPGVQHSFGALIEPDVLQLVSDAVSPLWHSFGRTTPDYGGVYGGLTVAICPPSLESAKPPTGELGYVRPAPLPEYDARPRERPLVYVTMGTMWAEPTVLQAVLDALADEPVDIVATLGQLDPGRLTRVPDNTRLEQYIPQGELLPRCAAVVHHAGAGTMFGVLAHGVPQVALPQAADNFVNADLLERAGAARVLRPAEVTAQAVKQAVRAVLDDASYAAVGKTIAAEIAAMPSADELAEDLRARYG